MAVARKKTATKKTAKKAAKKTTKKAAKKKTTKKATKKAAKKKTTKKAAKKTTKKAAKKKVAKKAPKKKAAKKSPARKKAATRKKTTRKAASRKKTAKKATKRKPNPAFMRPMELSSELQDVVGNKTMPRTQVTKKIWDYIKKNGLQDQQNKRMINADDRLKKVFGGKKKVSMFEMTKLVSKHMK